jgi:hypothetical protein
MVKKLVLILVAILLMVAILPAAPTFAAGSGSVNGSFVVGTPPVVDSVILTPTALSPMTSSPYDVTVNVSAPDTLASVNTVVFKVWHNTGTTPTKTEFDGLTTAAADTLAIITWTQSTGSTTISAGTPTSWTLGTCVVPTTFTGTSFAFHFLFTVGKIAMATTTTDKWQVGAEANGSGTGFSFDLEGATMNFYGEITVPSTTVSWGTLTAGTDFTDGVAQKPLGVTINYIANGNYNKQVASSSTWTQTTPPATATLDPGGTVATANQFALKANTSATLGTATLVGATGTNIDITGTRTPEAGFNYSSMNLWIKLASSFSAASYNGTITYSIVNR